MWSSFSRAGLRWTRQRRAREARAGRVVPVSPQASCRRAALQGSSRLQVSGSVDRARKTAAKWRAVRTAKPCGPDRRCYGQAFAEAALASTGAVPVTSAKVTEARTNSAPGRARHKPSDHRAGKAERSATPVCCCAVLSACAFRAADRGCQPAPGLPCALLASRVA